MKKMFAMAALAVAALSANAQEMNFDEYVMTPEQGEVSEISQIRIEYTTAYEVEVLLEEGVTLYNPAGNYVSSVVKVEKNVDGAPNILVVTPKNVQTTPGQYKLEISYGCVWLWDEEYSDDTIENEDDIYYYWTIKEPSSVDGCVVEHTSDAKVYNLQGAEVSADELSAGIYIRGGKKCVVK